MQRWFFADDLEKCDVAVPVPTPSPASISSTSTVISDREWTFCVQMNNEMLCNERVAIVGNTDSLGNWQFSGCLIMYKESGNNNNWFITVNIPSDRATEYRYLICAVDPNADQKIVRRWETYLEPRIVSVSPEEQDPNCCPDVFGCVNLVKRVDRGWLTTETIVQLKFFNAPFTLRQRMKSRLLYVKVTPMNLKIRATCDTQPLTGYAIEDSASNDNDSNNEPRNMREYDETGTAYADNTSGNNAAYTTGYTERNTAGNTEGDTEYVYDENPADTNDEHLSTAFAINEVTRLRADDSQIRPQPEFGTVCAADDLVIFHLTIGDFENTAYLIDLYTFSSNAAPDEPPYHFGYHYVLPNMLKRSDGYTDVPITCASKHRPLGMMRIGYLIIRPMPVKTVEPPEPQPEPLLNMRISYIRYWNPRYTGLDVGHRGSGTSFKACEGSNYRENTIFSLKRAADHGADMVEFDVMLSKDLVPVVYHDYWVYVSLKSKQRQQDFLALPVRELTLDQLNTLKVYHTDEVRLRQKRCFQDDELAEHQPFPQLADVLEAIDPNVGFNIEIKWSQKLYDGTMEDKFVPDVDRNLYVDTIVELVLRKAENRRIVFSCFDPDICTMIRFKQNLYPVMFLSQGDSTKYKKYMDPRGNTIESSVYNALAMQLLGIVAHTEDLLRDRRQISLATSRGLVLFCWGEDNNSKETILLLKSLGLHGIIYDRMDVLTTKETKQSVFMLQPDGDNTYQPLDMAQFWANSAAARNTIQPQNVCD